MIVRIEGLKKVYRKKTALESVDLTIGPGLFGLLGPNGAGKSTLMQIMATLLGPSAGSVHYGELQLGRDDRDIRRLLGYLPQQYGLYNRLTGAEFLEYIALLRGIGPLAERRRLARETLRKVDLTARADQTIRTYSGGMKQRIGIAQALLGDPRVLIVDEPTAGLDPEQRVRFRNLLAELALNRTIVLSTHIVADIEASCRQLGILAGGRLAFVGTPEELLVSLQGRVWQGRLSESRWALLQEKDGVIGVSGRKTADGVEARVIAERDPFPEAQPSVPTLEDGYLWVTGGAGRA